MAKEMFNDEQKKALARLNPKGKEFDDLATLTNASVTTVRIKEKEGRYLNVIDSLRETIRERDVQVVLSSKPKHLFAWIEAQE